MTYQETIEFLYSLRWFGAKLGLENSARLAALAGNPHHKLKFIHVAGTNGKGSTCAMVESICRAAGYRTGLFTSPHLVSFGERIQVNSIPISPKEVVSAVEGFRPWLATFPEGHHPTFFEVVTVLAMEHFREQACDIVIWETGLGGRLDATNIVTPLVSVITNIQFDHEKWLGHTLASIAFEKAGIIKPGVPVVTAADEPAALDVIRTVARERNAPLKVTSKNDARRFGTAELPVSLPGEHQKLNAALAAAALASQTVLCIADEHIRAGLAQVHWPGRLQMVPLGGNRKLLLDGAHNPAGARALADALPTLLPGIKPAMLLGILADKDVSAICQILAPLASRIALTPVHSERTAQPDSLAENCRHANPAARVKQFASAAEALHALENEPAIVATGSLYLVGEILELLGPTGRSSERQLNEWGAIHGNKKPNPG